ncbi:MAG: Yip1 family protein [Euryarchaeota archaeon]|nr:Yip1 family protein [Euryarchaeota archaeon]
MIKKILQKAWEVLHHPVEVFRKSKENRFEEAVIYYGILLGLNAVLSGILIISRFGLFSIIGFIPAFIFIGILGFIICISIIHVFVYLCGGRKGMDKTFISAIYGLTPFLLISWVAFPLLYSGIPGALILLFPLLGGLLCWSVVLIIVGIRELHEMSTLRVALAVIFPVVIAGALIIDITSHMRTFYTGPPYLGQ